MTEDQLNSWHSLSWRGLRVLVLGTGERGFAVADTLLELGARVLIAGPSIDEERAKILSVIGAEQAIGEPENLAEQLRNFEPQLVIQAVVAASREGEFLSAVLSELPGTLGGEIPVWGDLELSWRLGDKEGQAPDWVLFAGESAALAAELAGALLSQLDRAMMQAGGRWGPVLDAVRFPGSKDILLVNASADELAGALSTSPKVSVLLPRAEDLLAPSDEGFKHSYERTQVAALYYPGHQQHLDWLENADVVEGCRAISVSLGVPAPSGLGLVEDILCDRAFNADRYREAEEICELALLEKLGLASAEGVFAVLSAVAVCRAFEIPMPEIQRALAGIEVLTGEPEQEDGVEDS